MSEETLSEFVEELTRRSEPMPRDLIEKYTRKGLSASEMATALLARAALKQPEVPPSATEMSEKRLAELIERMGSRSAKSAASSSEGKLRRALGRLLRRRME